MAGTCRYSVGLTKRLIDIIEQADHRPIGIAVRMSPQVVKANKPELHAFLALTGYGDPTPVMFRSRWTGS
jgi:hypothetical protein